MPYLPCTRWFTLRTNKNPFEVYRALQGIKEHIKSCLPCLMVGTYERLMDKEITKVIVSAIVRLTASVMAWGTLITTFIYSHRHDAALTDRDGFFVLGAVMCMALSIFTTLMDGPREFDCR